MIYLYLTSFLIGAVFVGGSLLFGGDHDTGEHGGLDIHPHDVAAEGFLLFGNLRFWTFLALIFGLTGTLLDLSGSTPGWSLGLSVGMGAFAATAATLTLQRLARRQVSSGLTNQDYV